MRQLLLVAQSPEQSTQADVTVHLFIENKTDTFKARRCATQDHLTKKSATGFQKATQNPEQSNQADVTVVLFIENNIQVKGSTGLC